MLNTLKLNALAKATETISNVSEMTPRGYSPQTCRAYYFLTSPPWGMYEQVKNSHEDAQGLTESARSKKAGGLFFLSSEVE